MKRFTTHLTLALIGFTFSLIACNDEKTAGVEMSKDIPITSTSKEAVASLQEGLAYTDEANRAKAKAAFDRALEQDTGFGMAYLYRAAYSETAKDFVDRLEIAKKHLNDSNPWEKLFYDYQYSWITNNWDDRLAAVKKIVDLYPDAARAQIDLAYVYQEGNQTKEERAAFEKAVSLKPDWAPAYVNLASSYLGTEPKDFKKAEESALKATELDPKSAYAEVTLGDVYRAQDALDKAATAYAKATKLNPDDPTPYYKNGHVNSFLGNYDQARQDYAEGRKHDPEDFGSNNWTALTYVYAGDNKKALQVLEQHTLNLDSSKLSKSRIDGEKLNDYYSGALICLQDGDYAGVKKFAALMQAPANNIAADVGTEEEKKIQDAYVLYWQGLGLAAEGKLDDARAAVEQIKKNLALIKLPNKAQNCEMLEGYICMKEKKYTDAVSHFDKGNPFSVYIKYWQAKANEAAGNKDKANTLFNEVAIYNFNGPEFAVIRNEVRKKVGK